MPLYVVERDLAGVSAEQLQLDQRDVASACSHLKAQGKSVRYISSAVIPADGRGLDLFGSTGVDLVREAHAFARVPYVRIVEIRDATPTFLERSTSRPRRSLPRSGGVARPGPAREEVTDTGAAHSSPDLVRWLADGQRFFAACLDTLEGLGRVQGENEMLREEMARLRNRVDALQAERSEMMAAFNELAGQVTQAFDHIVLGPKAAAERRASPSCGASM
jgi:hypothetical protein